MIDHPSTGGWAPRRLYPKGWSGDVVDDFLAKHGRGADILCKRCGVPEGKFRDLLVRVFRFDNNRWNKLRDLIKACEAPRHEAGQASVGVGDLSDYLTFVEYLPRQLTLFGK